MNKMQIRLNKAIKKAKFNLFEIAGFKVDHKLSLLAGAAIGYKLAMEDIFELISTDNKASQQIGKMIANQEDMPPEFNRVVDKMLDDEIANG